jgi:hypothetical protein
MKKVLKNGTLLAVCCCVLLSFLGCEGSSRYGKGDLHIEDFRCSPEQFKAVKEEYAFCQETGYLGTYCFAAAKATICDKVDLAVVAKE